MLALNVLEYRSELIAKEGKRQFTIYKQTILSQKDHFVLKPANTHLYECQFVPIYVKEKLLAMRS